MFFLHSPQPTGLSPPFTGVATLHQSCCETKGLHTPQLSLLLAWAVSLAQGVLVFLLEDAHCVQIPDSLLLTTETVCGWSSLLAAPHGAAQVDKGWCGLQDKDFINDPNIATRGMKPWFPSLFLILDADFRLQLSCSFWATSFQTFSLCHYFPHIHCSPWRPLFFTKPQKGTGTKCSTSQLRRVLASLWGHRPPGAPTSLNHLRHFWGLKREAHPRLNGNHFQSPLRCEKDN